MIGADAVAVTAGVTGATGAAFARTGIATGADVRSDTTRGGYLHRLAGSDRVVVNSLHSQGVQTLGGNLEIEARAPDGLIEAFRVGNAPGFALAVQWHPEWQVLKNPFSHALFAAFGDAARARINARK